MNRHFAIAAATAALALLVGGFWWWTTARSPKVSQVELGLGGSRGGASGSPEDKPWFREVAAARGLDFRHFSDSNGHFRFPEICAGGVALFDFDGDSDLDVYVTQGNALGRAEVDPAITNRLYENDGTGNFKDVTARSGVGDTGYGMGCAVGDIDRDGDLDLFVVNCGADVLYRNEGDGRFANVTDTAGVGDPGWASSAAFVDIDGDGDLDLYVTRYIKWSAEQELVCHAGGGRRDYCSPLAYAAPLRDLFYTNDGTGKFTEVGVAFGLEAAYGNGLGVVVADFDRDGWIDVYVANDGLPNQLWHNEGGKAFVDIAPRDGAAVNHDGRSEAGMGVLAFDVEDDGDVDIFLTHLAGEHNTLYVYADGRFDDRSTASGLGWPSIPFTGFGVGNADFDQDGHGDVFVANGGVTLGLLPRGSDDVYAEPNLLFRGDGTGRFTEVQPRGGTVPSLVRTSRAAAFGDLDGDGDIDIVVVERDAELTLLENQVAAPGRWVMFTVLDADGHEAIGALVTLKAGGRLQSRLVQRASSYQASIDVRVHFGLGEGENVEEVSVRWLDGNVETFGAVAAAQVHRLRRGEGR